MREIGLPDIEQSDAQKYFVGGREMFHISIGPYIESVSNYREGLSQQDHQRNSHSVRFTPPFMPDSADDSVESPQGSPTGSTSSQRHAQL
jgi:hypothetical protein